MITAFLLAAGKSTRFGSNKLKEKVCGKTILEHSLTFLKESPLVDTVVVVGIDVPGGKTRFESVQKAVASVSPPKKGDLFVFHNAANPCATQKELAASILSVKGKIKGAAVGRKMTSTLKKISKKCVQETLPRDALYAMETPQVVDAVAFKNALDSSPSSPAMTDDLSVLEFAGHSCVVIEASDYNRKVTTPADLAIVREFFGDVPQDFRAGIGEDAHLFSSTKGGTIGGITVSSMQKLKADSDGDVILHALCNALSSALGGKSLGTFATKLCKTGEKDSREYLKVVLKKMRASHYNITSCSLSIQAVKPKIDPLVPRLKKSLGSLLDLPINRIGITATTGNGTAYDGIKVTAQVLLQQWK